MEKLNVTDNPWIRVRIAQTIFHVYTIWRCNLPVDFWISRFISKFLYLFSALYVKTVWGDCYTLSWLLFHLCRDKHWETVGRQFLFLQNKQFPLTESFHQMDSLLGSDTYTIFWRPKDLGYLLKNISLPSSQSYIYKLIEKTVQDLKLIKWKAFFFEKVAKVRITVVAANLVRVQINYR